MQKEQPEIKTLEVLNYHAMMIPKLITNLQLGKKERGLRKMIYQMLEKQNEIIQEELEAMRESHADLDEKGEKIVKMKMGSRITYSITGDNLEALNKDFMDLMSESAKIDILPSFAESLPAMREFLENADLRMTRQDEIAFERFLEIIAPAKKDESEEEPEKEVD